MSIRTLPKVTNGGDPSAFSQKEILTEFILPELKEINSKLDSKAATVDLLQVEKQVERLQDRCDSFSKQMAEMPGLIRRVIELEKRLSTPDQISNMIEQGLQVSKQRGWSARERTLGATVAVMTLLTLILNLSARF